MKRLLVDRLTDLWNPWDAIRLKSDWFHWLYEVEPLETFRHENRGKAYHRRRVRYFVDLIRTGCPVEPIVVDNISDRSRFYPFPCVDDGNHRLIACMITGQTHISAHYEGRSDVLRYLQGRRKTRPK